LLYCLEVQLVKMIYIWVFKTWLWMSFEGDEMTDWWIGLCPEAVSTLPEGMVGFFFFFSFFLLFTIWMRLRASGFGGMITQLDP
jgi:hypothetical protein